MLSPTSAVDPYGLVYQQGLDGTWITIGDSVDKATYDRIFGGAAGGEPYVDYFTQNGVHYGVRADGTAVAIPGQGPGGTGGGGAVGPTGTWQWNSDLGVYVQSITGEVRTPEQMGIQQTPQPFTLSQGERLLMRNEQTGQYEDVTPGAGEGDWTIINRDDGLYGYRTREDGSIDLQKLADFPMSEFDQQQLQLQRQQLALEAAQAGFPHVAYTEPGTGRQITQVRPETQILRGEEPRVQFEAAPTTAGVVAPVPAVTPGGAVATGGVVRPGPEIQAEMEAKRRAGVGGVTAERAAQIATALAQAPVNRGMFARLSGVAAVPVFGSQEPWSPTARKRALQTIGQMETGPRLGIAPVPVGALPGPVPPARPVGATGLAAGLQAAYRRRKRIPAVA